MNKENMSIEELKRAVLEKKVKEQLKQRGHQQRPSIKKVDRNMPLPLSFAQQRLWFIGQLDQAASQAYHLPAALRLTGKLDKPALTAALDSLIARHESLRTHFALVEGQPCQQIASEETRFCLSSLDLRNLDETARAKRVAELTESEAREPFDLMLGPLIRGQLLQLGDEEHVLLITQHHIISDGWSLGIFVREFSALYRAALGGHTAHLPPLPIQYADYAAWQRDWLKEDTLAEQRDFWHNRLQGAPALLELPTDRPRPAVQRYAGSHVSFHLSADVLSALKIQGHQQGTTLFMTVLTAWSLVLSRLSGQDDIVVGTPIANRTRHELEGLIGFFVNTLALRIELNQCKTLEALLAQVREQSLSAYAHQDLPFDQVVEVLQPARSLSYSPVFQVMLALNNTSSQRLTLPDLDVSFIEQPKHSAQFDLMLSISETDNGLTGSLEYAVDLFDRETIERVAGYVVNVLTAIATDVTQPLWSVPMLSADERQQVLLDFNPANAELPVPALIQARFEAQVQRSPDATAVVFESRSLSYQALNRRANQLAHHLIRLGVKPDDRVAICVERSPEMIIGLLAILKAGAAYLPLDPTYPSERLAYMLDDATPVALLTQSTLTAILPDTTLPTVLLDAHDAFDAQPDHNPDAHALGVTPDHLAYVIYTSGSTGKPKGVMVEHASVTRLLDATQDYFHFDSNDVWSQFHSFAFDFSVWEIWGALAYGGKLVVVPALCARSPQEFYSLLCRERVTVLNQTPGAFRQLIAAQDDTEHALRCIIFGGEALELHMLAPWITNNPLERTRLINMYGITEITVHATFRELTAADISAGRGSLIGTPLPDLRAYLLDPHGQPVPVGVGGELYIGGAGVARGYLNRPELTAERFIADPFSESPVTRLYKTGDLARWLPDGTLDYLGRNDFQVKVRGFRIELGEIESRLVQCSGVKEAVVLAREDVPGDIRLVAYVQPQSEAVLEPAELRQQLSTHLADYMLPSAFVTLDTFPLTPNGKLDRKALPAPERSAVVTRDYEEPVGDIETALAEIWQDLLGLERVGRYDHFFELGGHSLLIVSLIEKLRHLGLKLDVRSVFTAPTLIELADAVQHDRGEPRFTTPANLIPDDAEQITPDMLPLVTLSQQDIDAIADNVSGGAANIQDIYPLASLQEGILFHHRLHPDKDPYVVSSLLRVENQTKLDAFIAALQSVINRHDILRTSIHWTELTEPVQVVHRHAPLNVHHLEPENRNDVVTTMRDRVVSSHTSMDLTQAPLMHLYVAPDSTSPTRYVLLQFHHIIDDNLSLRQLLAETTAFLMGKGEALPPSFPYRNFVAYSRQEEKNQAAEAFFQDYLADIDEITAPFGVVNVQANGESATEARQSLRPEFSQTIRDVARRFGISPAALFHASWALVIARTSGRDDIVFGTTLSGRMSGLDGSTTALGMFINTLPFRIKLAGMSVATLVNTANNICASLLRYEQTPLSTAQRCSGLGTMPLFSALLNCRHTNDRGVEAPNLRQFGVESLFSRERTNYPLGISIDNNREYFSLSTQTISPIDPNRVNAYLLQAIEQVVSLLTTAPETLAEAIDILPASEYEQLSVGFNATHHDFPDDALIHQRFEQQVAQTPDAIAVVFGAQTLSYDGLNRRANQLAHHLLSLGVQPDDRIAICVERSVETIVGLLGILKAGAAYVPLDPAYPAERLAYMLDDAKPVALLTQMALIETLNSTLPLVILDDPQSAIFKSAPQDNLDATTLGLTPHHLAYVIYTSGSTGQPKGVMIEHRSLCNLANAQIRAFGITENSRLLQFASFSFDACISEVTTTLCQGACLVLASREELLPGDALLNTLQTQAITHVTLPPIAASALDPAAELPDLTTLIFAGEACPPALAKRWANEKRVINAYGPTESTVCATIYHCHHTGDDLLPIGKPIDNTHVYILDTKGQLAPLGVAGEIYLGGVGIARGYLNRPELTAERFIPDPYSNQPGARMYKTGDLGRWLPDGNIEYLGRNDFQIKLRGFRIEPGEIEARLMACSGVQDAIVIIREDNPNDKRLVAYIRPHTGAEIEPATLRLQLSQHLAEYMLPAAFVTLEQFPLTPNGKLDRKALPAPDQLSVATRGYEAPQGDIEIALADSWKTLLRLDRVGRRDHFFELGGHSLMAVNLIERLHHLGWTIDVSRIFSTPVLCEMAQAVQANQDKPAFSVPPNRIPKHCSALTPTMLPLATLTQAELDTVVATVSGGAANVQDIYSLSPLQQGILFHHRLQEQGDAYLLNSLLAFDNRERLDTFLHALQQVIDRHDILRTSFCWQGLTQPVQVVWRHAPLPVNTFVPASDDNILSQLKAYTDPRYRRLNLNQAPLLSADIAHNPATGEWLLAFGFHHLVGDHMTLDLIVSEITLLLQGRAETLPPSLPYRNFIAQILSVPPSVHEQYFRSRLADVDTPTAPFGILNTQDDSEHIAEARLPLDTTLALAIRKQARQLGISPSVLFHVAWAQVLAHVSNSDDVVFGSVFLGRLQGTAGASRIMGMFINTLPLRITLADRSVLDVVQETYRDLTALLEHEQTPLTLAQRCSGVMPPMPLFSALFNYRHSQPGTTTDRVWRGMRLLTAEERTNYPFTLSVDDLGERFRLVSQAIEGVDPLRLARYLETAIQGLIEALATEPQRPIMTLPILPDSERRQVMVDFNATDADFPQDALIHQCFEDQVARTPDAIAVLFEDQHISYDALNRRANQLAHHLIALGVKPDDRIAICVERSLDMVIGLLAILKAGAAYVPLDPGYPAERLAYMLDDADPVALLTQAGRHELQTDALPVILLDTADFSQHPETNPDIAGLDAHHLAYVIYTSGSTGKPKGVMNSHRGLCNRLVWMQNTYRLTPDDRVLQKTPFSFDVSVWEFFWPLLYGARLVMARPDGHKDAAYLAQLIERSGITTLHFVPSMLQQFVQWADADCTCDSLRRVICSGEALPAELQQRFFARFNAQLHNLYGPTEAAIDVTFWPCQPDDHRSFVPIGRPIANTQIYILDALGQPVPLGVAGELHIGGVGVARGYLNRPELTAERFIPDPFSNRPGARLYKTGDLARWLPDGSIEYLGRNDFQVKLRGFRIELGEIEARLMQCTGVQEAVVVAREDSPGDTRLVAYLCPQPGMTPDPADLRQQLSQHLAEYMVPGAFVTLDAFPLTPNGKLDRKALPAPDQSAVATRDYEAPQGDIEIALAAIWQDLLGLARIGRHDHFFELGGHSLMAVSLIERLRNVGLTLDVRSIFSAPVLSEMAQAILAHQDKPAVVVPPNRIPADCTAITPALLPLVTLTQPEIDTVVATVAGGAANVQDIYPLSPLQEGILFHYRFQEQGDTYLLYHLLAFQNRARLDAFLDALQRVIDRHDILRTAVCWQGLSQPVQVVWRQAVLPVNTFEPTSPNDVPAQLKKQTDPRTRRLNLNQAPLLSADIAHDPATGEWLLALGLHHLISDHMTLTLIVGEIRQLLQGQQDALPTPLPYRNFIAQILSVPNTEHEAYFRERLADIDAPTIPFDLLDIQGEGENIAEVRVPLPAPLSDAIYQQSRRLGISPGVLFHVAWAQVLAQTSGRDDVVFGTVLLGRLQGSAGADQVMGMFINTLPLRISLAERSVLDAVQETYHDLTTLLAHEQTPLALAQRCSGVAPPMPLFSALLNYRHTQINKDTRPWEGIRVLTENIRTNYPFTLSVDDIGDGFSFLAQTSTEIDPARIAHYLFTAIHGLVDALENEPQRPVLTLSVLPENERQKLLVDFNATDIAQPDSALAHVLFEEQVKRTPDATAVIFESQPLSYDELNRRANRLAHHLLSLGIRPDDRVAICVERSLEMVVGMLAVLKAGGAYVPLDPSYPVDRLTYMLEDAEPVALLTQTDLTAQLDSSLPVIELDNLPAAIAEETPDSNPDPQSFGLTPRHLAYVIYTSGSTGKPKGVMVEHRSMCNLLSGQIEALHIAADSHVIQLASFSFDVCMQECCMTLLAGATLYLAERAAILPGAALRQTLEDNTITHMLITPTALAALDGLPETLQTLVVGGEICPPALVKRWAAGRHMFNAYGPTETTVCATLYPCSIQDEREPCIGRPLANTRIYILDPQGKLVPIGATGEIHIGGTGVARGYLNRTELTAEHFIVDPFTDDPDARLYKTGDLGRWLHDGNIDYLGRNDFQVKVRGFRIELGEIEARLIQCAGVKEAVAIAREDEPGETRLVAYLIAQPGVELVPAELRQQLAHHLAEYMVPSAFVTMDTFPLTPNGKLDRKALPAPDRTAVVTRTYEAPVGEKETVLSSIWQHLLGLTHVGRRDHFFELGGHSLMAVNLIERLRNLGYRLDVRSVFASPTLADMAVSMQVQQENHLNNVAPNLIPTACQYITPDLLPLITLSQNEIDAIVASVHGGAANVQDIYPLSPLQEGILFHHRLQAQGDAYLLTNLVAFDTRERLDDFLDALQSVIERHDILRTALYWQGLNQPVQVVWRQAPLSVNTFIPAQKEHVLAQLKAYTDPSVRRLNLNQAPLFATDIVHDAERNEWLLALTFHHLIGDHMTLALIIEEVRLLLQNRGDELPTPLPYRNFIAQNLSVPASAHEDYFRSRLADIDEPTAPFGLLDIQGDGGDVVKASERLAPSLAMAIRKQCRQLGISPGVLFHVAWAQVLAQTSGRDDVVFGSVLLGRLQGSAGADRVMGMFINTLPLRLSLAEHGVRDIVQSTYRDLTALLEHEQTPLSVALRCSGVTPPIPLFSTLLNYRHSQTGASDNSAWSGIKLLATEERTNYPITLSVDDLGEGFSLVAQTVSEIDPARIVNYMMTALRGLVEALAIDPLQPILGLSVLPEEERKTLLVDFNATEAELPHELLHQLFEQQAARTPDAIAIVFEDQWLSYAELNRRANQLAHHLLSLDVKPDDRIAICVERSPEMVVGLLGVLKAGAAYVPLDPSYPAERLAYMLDDSAPVALLTHSSLLELLHGDLPTILLDNVSLFDANPENNPEAQTLGLAPHHLAYIIYTSGSTGKPKGVMVEHRNIVASTYARQLTYPPFERVLLLSSIAFDSALASVFGTLTRGGSLYLPEQAITVDPTAILHRLHEHRICCLLCVPSLALSLLQMSHNEELASLQALIVAGERCPPEIHTAIEQLGLSTAMYNEYGPTEAAVWASVYPVVSTETSHARFTVPIGHPIANSHIYILDPQGRPALLNVAGEIHIGGAGVARGYLNRPDLTAERFIPDPFSHAPEARMYKTGDLGRWLPDGNIDYLGRNDFQVKVRGFRIELGEIEARLMQLPGVQEAVVAAREDIPGDMRLVAYLRSQPDTDLNPADLRQQLAEQLAEYMVPSAFVTLDAFPLTPNGKIDRKALPAPDQSAVATRGYVAPQGELETALAQIWQELLGLDRVGRHDQFFELGGHSLMAVSLIERLRNIGQTLDVRSVFSAPVLCDMAQSILTNRSKQPLVVPPSLISPDCTAITPELLPLISLSQRDIDTIVATVPGGAANVQDIYPLAPLQEGILFHYLLQEQGDTYLSQTVIAFDTRERLDTFLSALQRVIERHDILHTAVCWQGLSQPVQVVWRHTQLAINTLESDSDNDVPGQLRAHTSSHTRRINLSQAPLLTADIAHDTANQEWLLALGFHHLVCDHITLALMIDEIRTILQGHDDDLPTPLPYRNFIAQILSVPMSAHEAYFRSRLADVDEPTAPFGLVDIKTTGESMDETMQYLEPALAQAIRHRANRLGVSPSVLFHVAWAQVLAHISNRDDVVFGSVLLGRLQGTDGADRVMGMFINTLPLRISLNNRSAIDVVRSTYDELISLLEHEQTPLALAQRCSGVMPPLPLFSTLFNFRHSQHSAANNDTTTRVWQGMRQLTVEERTNYPLTVSVDDLGKNFRLVAQTHSEIDSSRIAQYLEAAIKGLIEVLATEPQRPIMTLPILPDSERQQVMVDFNATDADFPQDALIHQCFEDQVARTPDAIAVLFEDQHISYDALNRRANQLAHHLIALGVKPDDRIAICVERSLDMVIGLLAILKAGAAYVPLDPGYPAERLAYMLDDAAPVALLTQAGRHELQTDALPVILLDTADFSQHPETNPDIAGLDAHHLAYVIYTSGSTGKPKGVMNSHRGLCNRLVWMQNTYRLTPDDRVLQKTPFSFDVSVWEFFWPLLYGARLVMARPDGHKDAAYLAQLIERSGITTLHFVPSMLQQFVQWADADCTCDSLRRVICSGEALPAELQQRFFARFNAQLHNLYGPTEAAIDVTFWPCQPDDHRSFVPIGRPIANTQIYILDALGQPVPLGVAGELHIGGVGVARGYLNRPELTAERFIPDPFSDRPGARLYKTGDLARWLPDGSIEYLGRNDFQVKLRGFRIELGEIEARLMQCTGVQEAVVVAREDSPGDTRLVAYLCPLPGIELMPAELRQQLSTHLADYMIPSAFVMLDTFPLTPNGKLDRKALPAPDQTAVVSHGYEAPQGEVETKLAHIWQTLLGLERIGRYDHFFELGGHSLLAVQLLNHMREQGMEVSLATLFSHPTLCDLAFVVGSDTLATSDSPFDVNPVPLSPEGNLLPLFLIHESSGDPLVYSTFATLLPPALPVYALQALGLHTLPSPPASIEELATYHLNAIRRIQPHGPYRLAGWSLGGSIAYEIGLQMRASGEEVAFLGMIDSYNFHRPDAHASEQKSVYSHEGLSDEQENINIIFVYLRNHMPMADKKELEDLRALADINQIIARCHERQWLPSGITKEDILLRLNSQRAILQLSQHYHTPASTLPIHLYRSEHTAGDDIWGEWQGIVGKDSVLHPIGGTHYTIMQPPLLNQVADSFSELLLPNDAVPNIVIQNGTPGIPPLFCIPGAGANASSFIELALALPTQQPVCALQARGLTEISQPPYISVEGAARAYLQGIRQKQHHGPYHLLGHSFGGWVAFELALQLQAQGESVASLILVDTDAPDIQGDPPKSIDRIETIMKLIDIYNMILTQPLALTRSQFVDVAPEKQIALLHRALVKAGIFSTHTTTSLLQGIVQVMQANLNTVYTPRARYEGGLYLVSAKEGDIDERTTNDSEWRTHVTQLDPVLMPGNHMTMLSMPQVERLADWLWQTLNLRK
ncbi:non-ribosomal peptide synthase/polyketide synthase [Pectobacterium versatile]|uniref:non-ribosomal peptide synthetase n=30 Tax=Pectobacterium TaxID=122277 RepID=UPI003D9AD752